jgi:hypothetical protein
LNMASAKAVQPDSFSYSLEHDADPNVEGPVPHDLSALEGQTIGWAPEQWWDWLNNGLDEIAKNSPTAHLSFSPLSLYPLDRYPQQLGAAFREGKQHGLTLYNRVLTAIQCYLQLGDPSTDALPGRNDAWFWELLGELGPWDPELSIPQGYLDRLTADDKLKSMSSQLCTAICDCVWASNAEPGMLAAFFDRFSSNVNQPAVQGSYMVATINQAGRTMPSSSIEFAAAAADAMVVISPPPVEAREIREYVDAVLTSGLVAPPLLQGVSRPGFSHLLEAIQPLAKKYADVQGQPSVETPRRLEDTIIPTLVPA